jgi:hypothetical protein
VPISRSVSKWRARVKLIAWLKANPGAVSQATVGIGSPPHLLGLLFQKETGTAFHLSPIAARLWRCQCRRAPEALRKLQEAEIAKWWPLLKAANIKAE